MKNRYPVIMVGIFVIVISALASAYPAEKVPVELKGARFVFDSDRDRASDGASSVYLWEDGRTSKLFKGAICPRWSPDGERIACVLRVPGKEGEIAILDRSGTMRTEMAPIERAQAVEWLDANNLIYIARGQGEPEFVKTYIILYDLVTNVEKKLYSTQESGEIYQMNWDRAHDNLILDTRDRFSEGTEFTRRNVLLNVKAGGPPRVLYGYSAYKPSLFHDDETLVFQSDLKMDGRPAAKAGTGALAAYDIRSGEWAGIRDALSIQNTRLSEDGRYFYSAEAEGSDTVIIRLFSVEDLNRPLLRVSPKKSVLSRPYKDLRPDLFIPGAAAAIAVSPVYLSGGVLSSKTGIHETAVQDTVVQKTAAERVPRAARPAARPAVRPVRPALSERLTWRPDPNRTVVQRGAPDATGRTLPQLDSEAAKPFEKTPALSTTKTYEPLQTAEDARQDMIMKEAVPGAQKYTSEANKPLEKGPTYYSEPEPVPGNIVQTAVAPVHSNLPPGVRVPPGMTPTQRGWYYETSLGDRITVEYSEDGSSYTVTEEGPNLNSKTTYPVYGAKK